jgi:hypothetical protein
VGRKWGGQKDGEHFLPNHFFASELLVSKNAMPTLSTSRSLSSVFHRAVEKSRANVSEVQSTAAQAYLEFDAISLR